MKIDLTKIHEQYTEDKEAVDFKAEPEYYTINRFIHDDPLVEHEYISNDNDSNPKNIRVIIELAGDNVPWNLNRYFAERFIERFHKYDLYKDKAGICYDDSYDIAREFNYDRIVIVLPIEILENKVKGFNELLEASLSYAFSCAVNLAKKYDRLDSQLVQFIPSEQPIEV